MKCSCTLPLDAVKLIDWPYESSRRHAGLSTYQGPFPRAVLVQSSSFMEQERLIKWEITCALLTGLWTGKHS